MAPAHRTLRPEIFATQRRATRFGPDAEGHTRKMAKLIIIDGDPEMIAMGRRLLDESCDMPGRMPPAKSLEEAKALVDLHGPDIILTGRRIGGNLYACCDLLDYAKSKNNKTTVILWSDWSKGGEHREGENHRFDAVVDIRKPGEVRGVVAYYSGVRFAQDLA